MKLCCQINPWGYCVACDAEICNDCWGSKDEPKDCLKDVLGAGSIAKWHKWSLWPKDLLGCTSREYNVQK